MDRSWIPTVAGVLDILAGVPALIAVLALLFAGAMLGVVPEEDEVPVEWVQALLVCIAGLVFAGGVLAVIGGAFALQRRRFGWMLVGAIAAAVCFPPLGVPAIVLTVLAEKEVRPAS